jgi:hypothetical protein
MVNKILKELINSDMRVYDCFTDTVITDDFESELPTYDRFLTALEKAIKHQIKWLEHTGKSHDSEPLKSFDSWLTRVLGIRARFLNPEVMKPFIAASWKSIMNDFLMDENPSLVFSITLFLLWNRESPQAKKSLVPDSIRDYNEYQRNYMKTQRERLRAESGFGKHFTLLTALMNQYSSLLKRHSNILLEIQTLQNSLGDIQGDITIREKNLKELLANPTQMSESQHSQLTKLLTSSESSPS